MGRPFESYGPHTEADRIDHYIRLGGSDHVYRFKARVWKEQDEDEGE